MKFSVIIPVYDCAPYLRECLDSVCVAAKEVEKRGGGGLCTVEPYRKWITVDLGAFDDFLAGYPELYREAGELFIPSNKFPLRHVREWRRRSANTLKFFLLRVYKGLMGIRRRMRSWRLFLP